MNSSGWIQLALFVAVLLLITKPLGLYLVRVLDANGITFLDPVFKPVERLCYKLFGIDPNEEHDWKRYTIAMLMFSLVTMLFTYAILRLQAVLPLNPQKMASVSADLSFNTAASFTTNTNWQSYGGEATMSYFSQMVGLAFHNFASAATGIAIAAALVRGIARHSSKRSAISGPILRAHSLRARADLPDLRALSRVAGHDSKLQALRHGSLDRASRDTIQPVTAPVRWMKGQTGVGLMANP